MSTSKNILTAVNSNLKIQIHNTREEKELTDSPICSPRSAATRSETEIADILLGCVHMMLHAAPRVASISDSNMYWGSCVVLPQPVSPETTMTYVRCKQNTLKNVIIDQLI